MAKAPDDPAVALPESVVVLLAEVARLGGDRFAENLRPLDLSPRPAQLLLALVESPTGQNALARRFGIDRTTMVALMDDFEARGFVERLADPADRRAYRLQLTKAGRATARLVATRLRQAERDLLSGLSERQRTQFGTALRTILAGR